MKKRTLRLVSMFIALVFVIGLVQIVGASAADGVEPDLEFSAAKSIDGFTAENGSVAWGSGCLVWTLNGGNTLSSPRLSYTSGKAYSAKLQLRNTFYVRMANATSASKIRVYFMTDSDKDYTSAKSCEFDVKPNSAETTYYFNLSGNTKATGILRGFRFELVGASSGSASIQAISFEREAPEYEYAGTLTSCRAEGTVESGKVIIKGKLNDKYAGKTVSLYETQVENYAESLKSNEIIAEVTANGKDFTFEIPLKDGKTSRLSSMFLIGVNGVRVCDRFSVENYTEYLTNPYAFDTPNRTVKVTDSKYGAKGDGYTDDTRAIQKAIDDVSAQGGGKVTVPEDDSKFGKRYIVTTLTLKDGVELCIEKNAVLWQSPRPDDYPYDVEYGHDVSISGVNWTHAGLCHNYPIIYAVNAKNIKLTGGGTIRSVDTGSECIDSVSGDIIWTGCENRIHLISIGFQFCENVEIRDIRIRRANCYHTMFRNCKNLYVANLDMREATCASGDGIGISAGCSDITLDHCFLYSNDDAITMTSSYDDPRGKVWWHTTPELDNGIHRVTIRSCNLFGGHGLTFIPWGTDNTDLTKQIISDISATDNVFAGGSSAIGTWPDNPYMNKPFDNTETNDYSPVQNVTLIGNKCRGTVDLQCLKITGLYSDCGLKAAANFEYGNFEHRAVKGSKLKKLTWTNGLSNWNSTLKDADSSVSVGQNEDGSNHYGVLIGNATLYEGLYMCKGSHKFSVDVAKFSGTVKLFAVDMLTGQTVAERKVKAGSDFTTVSLSFKCENSATLNIGVEIIDGEAWIDNASVTSKPPAKQMYFTEDFSSGESVNLQFDGMEVIDDNGNLYVHSEGGIQEITAPNNYKDVKMSWSMRLNGSLSDIDSNVGVCVCGDDNGASYFFEYNATYGYLQVRVFNGGEKQLFLETGYQFPTGKWVDCSITVENGHFVWTIDGDEAITLDDNTLTSGKMLINLYNVSCDVDNVTVEPFGANSETEYETEPEVEETDEPYDEDEDTEAGTVAETDGEQPIETSVETETQATVSEQETIADNQNGGCCSYVGFGVLTILAIAGFAVSFKKNNKIINIFSEEK